MALTTDAEYLIHMMRIKFLRMDERGERIMAFPPTVMSDDYVRLAAPHYPEMQYCYSPAYDMTSNKENPIFGTNLMNSPRTKRTQHRPPRKNVLMTNMNNNNHDNTTDSKLLPTLGIDNNSSSPTVLASRTESVSDSDDDDFMIKQQQQEQRQLQQQRQPLTSAGLRNKDDATTSIFSQGGVSELTTTASLHPSMESNIDPSPRSSLDVIENQQDNSFPFMHVAPVAPRASVDTSRYAKPPSILSPTPPVPPPKNNSNINNPSSSSPTTSNIVNVIKPTPLSNANSSVLAHRKQPSSSCSFSMSSSPSMIPPPTTDTTTTNTTVSTNMSSSSLSSSSSSLVPTQNISTTSLSPGTSSPSATLPTPRRFHIIPGKSALTAMIAAKASSAENPFSAYSHASGKGSSHPMTLCVYLPHSSSPYRPVSLVVRPDAIIDDVIGYILYDYVEQKCKPELDSEVYDLAQWVLLIAEDDGEIEDDLPALDRTRKIDKVSFDQFALCRANPSQAKQNEQIRAKLGRFKPDIDALKKKPSMMLGSVTVTKEKEMNHLETNNTLLAPVMAKAVSSSTSHSSSSNNNNANNNNNSSSISNVNDTEQTQVLLTAQPMENTTSSATSSSSASMITTAPSMLTMLPADVVADSSSIAVPVPSSKAVLTKAALPMTPIKYFRIRLMTSEEVAATTTIPVYAEMFIGDVLELVSRKRKLDPDEYILTIPDTNVVVSNDTAVEHLKDVEELTLTKKGTALTVPSTSSTALWRSPIKKRKEDTHSPMYFNATDINKQPSDNFLQQYKKYNVNRKTPMFVGKRVSVLAIDGNYIHLMPPEHKGMFDSVKTTSFHVSNIRSCKQSKKVPSNFKVNVMKERDYKTYELEAETAKEAYEICARIRFLIQMNKGTGT